MAAHQVIVSSVVDAAVSLVKDIFQNRFSVDKDDSIKEGNDPILMSTITTTTITKSTVNERGTRSTTTTTQTTSKQMGMNDNGTISQKLLDNNNTRNHNRSLANNTQSKQQQRQGQRQQQEGLTREGKFSRQKNNSNHRATPQTTTTKRSQSVPTRPQTASRFLTKEPKRSSKQKPLHQITTTTVTRPQTIPTQPISRFVVKNQNDLRVHQVVAKNPHKIRSPNPYNHNTRTRTRSKHTNIYHLTQATAITK